MTTRSMRHGARVPLSAPSAGFRARFRMDIVACLGSGRRERTMRSSWLAPRADKSLEFRRVANAEFDNFRKSKR